jgi:serine/threonine protein kinase
MARDPLRPFSESDVINLPLIYKSKARELRKKREAASNGTCEKPFRYEPGMQLGPFSLFTKLAKGGWSEVWTADREMGIPRFVAKLPLHPKNKGLVEGIRREGNIHQRYLGSYAERLQEGFIPVIEMKVDGEIPFLILDRMNGIGLSRLIHFQLKNRLSLIEKFLESLAALHQRNITHRDIKPGNAMYVPRYKKVFLYDFALAQHPDFPLDEKDYLAGTPPFMAPEVVFQRKDLIGPPTDVYAAGISIRDLIFNDLTTPISELLDHLKLPKDLSPLIEVISKATAPNPIDRFQNGTELLDAFRAAKQAVLKSEVELEPPLSPVDYALDLAATD